MNLMAPNTETGVLIAEVQRLKFELECLKASHQFHYGDALGFLRAVYNNEALPLAVRLDAARTAIKYETPSLSAVAVNSIEEPSIAEKLENARKRYEEQQREQRALSSQDQKLKMIS
jgi:hypothetical protein